MYDLKKILLFISGLVITPMILGVIINNTISKKVTENSNENLNKVEFVKYTESEIQNLSYQEILNGNYTSLQGTWKNAAKSPQRLTIDSGMLLFEGERYFLNLGGKTEWGIPYLDTRGENNLKYSAKLTFYPAGTVIPVRLEDGTVEYSGKHDPSDKSKDRLLFAQTILSEKGLKNNVCYRKR
jgi:hypothetical protein